MQQTLTICTPEGELKDVRAIGARISEFNKKFPARRGWELRSEITLIDSALGPSVLAKATLVRNRNGAERVVRTAHSLSRLAEEKDLEKTETNAISRVLRYVGIGSDLLNEDEIRDLTQAGFTVGQVPTGPAPEVTGSSSTPNRRSDAERDPIESGSATGQTPGPTDEPEAKDADPPTPVQLNGIKRLAGALKVPVPSPTTFAEARDAILTLRQQQTERLHGANTH